MSDGMRTLWLSAALAAGIGFLAVTPAQSQQLQRRDDQKSPMRDFQQMREAQQSQMRARIAGAIQQVQGACSEEMRNFCSTVTPGEGRVLLCMQAHEDKLGRPCELALFEASRNIEHAVRRVERIADACWNDIQKHCASAGGGSIAQCVNDKSSFFTPQCQAVVAASQQAGQQAGQPGPKQQPAMTGLSIYSSDGMRLGEVTGVKTGADGRVEAIEAEIGSLLGLGSNAVLISPDELEWRGDRIELRMAAEQVRTILQGQRR